MKLDIKIPTNLDDITLRQYTEYEKLINTDIDANTLKLKRISIFCNIPIETAKKITVTDIDEMDMIIVNVLNQHSLFTNRFKMNGKEYGFIPNLDKMSFGEYVDLDTFSQQGNLARMMCILYRPVVGKFNDMYRIEEYSGEEDPEKMLDMSMDIVNGALLFFSRLRNELLKAIPSCLEKQLSKDTVLLQRLEKSGVGTQAFLDSLKEEFGKLEKLLD